MLDLKQNNYKRGLFEVLEPAKRRPEECQEEGILRKGSFGGLWALAGDV